MDNNELTSSQTNESVVVEKDLHALQNTDILKLMSRGSISKDSDLFNEGFVSLLEGYVDYAREVLTNRAVPDLRDGLKPVQRYAIWALYTSKSKDFQKSGHVANSVLKYHPHNAESAYESLSKMADSNGTFRVPLLEGDGDLGSYVGGSPAAPRYTGVRLHSFANELFTAMNGIKMVANFDATEVSAEVLPVSYPYYLCKSADGIAVGFSTNSASFTVEDVCGLVEEYITTGKLKTKIIPDFVTGGYIVPTERELDKLMMTGRGKFVNRGKVVIDGKNIYIRELPHGVTVDKLIKDIEKADLKGISTVSDLADTEFLCNIEVVCKSKNRVDEVLVELYNKTCLQNNFNSNLVCVEEGKLVITGVWGIIERWTKWRREVLRKQFAHELEKKKSDIKFVDNFNKLLNIEGARDEVVRLATKESDEKAIQKIIEYVGCEYDVAKWIISRRLNQFRNDSKYKAQYENLTIEIKDLESKLESVENIDKVILEDMKRVKSTIGAKIPRRTQISDTVYKESDMISETAEERVFSCYYEIKDGFIKKMNYLPDESEGAIRIGAYSNSVLIAISNAGEIYRIYGDDLELSYSSSIGTYIPTYSGIKHSTEVEILWGTVCDGTKYVLTYSDGFVGYLDTTEFLEGTIKSKYMRSGISEHAQFLTDVREYQNNSVILVQTFDGKLAIAYLDSIKQKSRTARTRVWKSEEIYDSMVIPIDELEYRIPSYEKLLTKKPIAFNGKIDVESHIEDLRRGLVQV